MNPSKDIKKSDLKNPSLQCYDLEQYNPSAHRIQITIFANYKKKTYFTDIYIHTNTCVWLGDKWIPHFEKFKYLETGLMIIKDTILRPEDYKNKNFF
jgi:hypothetical protein